MSEIEDILVRLRARLQERDVKLWEEPYYVESGGVVIESALEQLSQELSPEMHISASICKSALLQLQETALRKLAARRQFNETGLATFHVRCVDSHGGTANRFEVKCALDELGANLQLNIADQLQLSEAAHVKCISAGRVLAPQETLQSQGLKNNQQLLVIVGQDDGKGEALYERIRQIQRDVEMVVDSEHRFVELEDQDGNVIMLPPSENRALLLGMGLYEKGRAAMRREHFDEALLLFLDADEKFSGCNSRFLEAVDNYGLLNLDIVWCYLCLKNITQLPDAQRRLDLCERNFQRSYGDNYSRLYALKGANCPERALIMRLQLLQGVILFHQNRRDEAFQRLQLAGNSLSQLKVDADQLALLIEMGFDVADARLALRSSNGNVEQAVQSIQERRQRLQATRLNSNSESEMHRRLTQLQLGNDERDWVHPRSVCRLMELGFERQLVVEALRRTDNNLERSEELLRSHSDELRRNLPAAVAADEQMLYTLHELGFKLPTARAALETTRNDMDRAVDFLLKSLPNEHELNNMIELMNQLTAPTDGTASASTSSPLTAITPSKLTLIQSILSKANTELESYNAYKRFHEDLPENEQDYLNLTLEQEEQILNEYKRLLEH
ncbi:NEDD8 ultimate buster 1 [Drosophila albomicans]|uniref:NEDD8 ultimate buster 1 n=1 Tax=Drosophila albomicans TaxID=7291 RepID=A0A6P8XWZ9_DROAB|nr:NEDD8 ultimate buster 1 [Drosophila albomicans]